MLNRIELSRVDINLLVLFDVVLREGHVGRAASRLNLSPSAVSHGLGRLRRLLNDPLFLRNPKGVVPTARAVLLAGPIAEILDRVSNVVASAEPFEAARSTRRFMIGASDGIAAAVLPGLLAEMRDTAPGVDLGVRNLLPPFEDAFADLDSRALDVAILPMDEIPARFASRTLYEEDFVIAMRAGHPMGVAPSLARYCAARHVVVSQSGDTQGFVDEALAEQGLARRIALTVPNFMLVLAVLAETDLVAAVPESIAARHARRFGVVSGRPPVTLRRYRIRAVAPQVAMMDEGLAWLMDLLERTSP